MRRDDIDDDKPFLAGTKVMWMGMEVEVISYEPCGSVFSEDPDDFLYYIKFEGTEYCVHGQYIDKIEEKR